MPAIVIRDCDDDESMETDSVAVSTHTHTCTIIYPRRVSMSTPRNFLFLFGPSENHPITPAARRVELQTVSDLY